MFFRTTYAQILTGDTVERARRAAEKIRADFAGFPASMIIYFAATDYDAEALAAAMHAAFPDAVSYGCTSAGEGVDGSYLGASVAAMAFAEEVFDYCQTALVVGGGQKADGERIFDSVDAAMAHLGRGLYHDLLDLDHRQYVGFVLGDCISLFSEAMLDRIGELTDVIFMGGYAGDDYQFENGQRVFFQGRAYRSAAVVALWKPHRGFSLLKTQAVEPTDKTMIITKADEEQRIVWELDGQPAAPLYAKLIGAEVGAMTNNDFDEHPFALTADGEPFIRVVYRMIEGRGLQMFTGIREGIRLTLTRSGDIYNATARDLSNKIRAEGPFASMVHIDCAGRFAALRRRGQIERYSDLFKGLPNIMLASYGEIYLNSVAMTSTSILFK